VLLLDVDHPRVALVRDSRAAPNWPSPGPRSGTSAPVALDLGRLNLSNLELHWQDVDTDLHVDITGLSLHLVEAGGRAVGPVRWSGSGRIQWNDRGTTIDALEGAIAWNGYDLSVDGLRVVVPEGQLRLDGRVRANRVDLRVSAD